MDRKVTAPASISIPCPRQHLEKGLRGSRSPAPVLRLASPALECLSAPGFVSQNTWNLRNHAFKPHIKCHPFYLASRAFREDMLLSDPRYRWGGKLQGYKSVGSQKKKKETIINDKCFLLSLASLPVPLDSDWEHNCYWCSCNMLMGHKLDRKNLGLKVFLKEK